MSVKPFLKRVIFGVLGKDPEAVVVSIASGPEARVRAMVEEFRALVQDRRHFLVRVGPRQGWEPESVICLEPGSISSLWRQLRRAFRRYRIGQAAVLFDRSPEGRALRTAAFLLAPGKILAYNAALERHHLRLRSWIASWLFLRGVPLDRIFLRPRWLWPWKRDRTQIPQEFRVLEGRPTSGRRRKVAVLSPYFPYPLSHGGAVRIFHLLKEASRQFDIFLFAFTEPGQPVESGPVLEFCAKAVLVEKPRYREPRWSTLLPPEAHEYESPVMRRLVEQFRREHSIDLVQVEYTQLARYGGDVLVEHDVTFDLYQQLHERRGTLSSWWDWKRWLWFERRAVRRYRRVVAMSEKDRALLGGPNVRVIPNGVDLERFRPAPEPAGQRLLFIGSFRHFPNIVAYRFLTEEVWPRIRESIPEAVLTVVAGPTPEVFWREATGTPMPEPAEGVTLMGFVRDVCPLYEAAHVVVVPTLVSAGTNLKVLEAMAMERAVVSTPSGCAGLGLEHGESVWVASGAEEFAEGVRRLLRDEALRRRIAERARQFAVERYGWRSLGALQRGLWWGLLGAEVRIRSATSEDLDAIAAIQEASPEAAHWRPQDYLGANCSVAEQSGQVVGFLAWRRTSAEEAEILNLAVAPEARRQGIATRLVEETAAAAGGRLWLEVRPSNVAARKLYEKLGFQEAGLRPNYYPDPPEDGIVMKLQSW
jgi:ribosomal-protein-alanine acetyltransferase